MSRSRERPRRARWCVPTSMTRWWPARQVHASARPARQGWQARGPPRVAVRAHSRAAGCGQQRTPGCRAWRQSLEHRARTHTLTVYATPWIYTARPSSHIPALLWRCSRLGRRVWRSARAPDGNADVFYRARIEGGAVLFCVSGQFTLPLSSSLWRSSPRA